MHEKQRRLTSGFLILALLFQCSLLSPVYAFTDDEYMPVPPEALGKAVMQLAQEEEQKEEPVLSEDSDALEERLAQEEKKLQEEDNRLLEHFPEEPELLSLSERQEIERAEQNGTVFQDGNSIYANGVPVRIKEVGGSVFVFDEAGENKLLEAPVTSAVTIYGGAKDADVAATKIILESGNVANIIGGGRTGKVGGNTEIILRGGAVKGLVCGGGRETAATVKGTSIYAEGTTHAKWIYGGGYKGAVSNDTMVNLQGGSYSYVCGGGWSGIVGGNTEVKLANATVNDTVFGGGWHDRVEGNTSTELFDGASVQFLCGGGYLLEGTDDSTVNGSTRLVINGGEVSDTVYGGGWNSSVKESTEIIVNGGRITNLYGGGYGGKVEKGTRVELAGGEISTTLYGGGQKDGAEVLATNILLTGGTAGWLYGGGWKAKVTEKTRVDFQGGTVKNIAFGGGHFQSAVTKGTEMILADGSSVEFLYGGGEWGPVEGKTDITFQGGSVSSAYGGGRTEDAVVTDSTVSMQGGQIDFLFGGGNAGAVLEMAEIVIAGGVMQSVYGGSAEGSVKNTNVSVEGGTVGWLYGGGKNGIVEETAQVNMRDGTIEKNLFGGGRGETGTVKNTKVTMEGGSLGGVFAGGDKGTVTENTDLTLLAQNSIPFASGGGYSGAVNGKAAVTLENAQVQTVYGGSYAGVTQEVLFTMKNGEVFQLILGSGTGGSADTVKLMIQGGLAEELYPGYSNAVNLTYMGGSILNNHAGRFYAPDGTSLFKTQLLIGQPPQKNQAVECQFAEQTAWPSKTDIDGKLVVYLPAEEKKVSATNEAGILYQAMVTANKAGTASFTLTEENDSEGFTVSFGVKEGAGTVKAEAENQEISSGTRLPEGTKVVFTAVPETGAALETWWKNGEEESVQNPYTIESLSENVNVEAVFQQNSGEVDKTLLSIAIEQARTEKEQVCVSLDGTDLSEADSWVRRAEMKAFQNAILQAEAVFEDDNAAQADVDSALSALEEEQTAFENAKQIGTGPGAAVNRVELNTLLTQAWEELCSIKVSADGTDVEAGKKWVTEETRMLFQQAIAEAEGIAEAPASSQNEIDNALKSLKDAENFFLSAQQEGTGKKKFRLTFYGVGNGTVQAAVGNKSIQSPYMVSGDDSILITAVPQRGYTIEKWVKNGEIVENDKDSLLLENMQAPVSVVVYFGKAGESYEISIAGDVTGGLIGVSPSGRVTPGTMVRVTVLPDEGWQLAENSLKYNGQLIKEYQFVMPAENVVITAKFEKIEQKKIYSLTLTAGTGGQVSGGGDYEEGETAVITARASSGYSFVRWESQDENYIEDCLKARTQVHMPGKPMQAKAVFQKRNSNNGGGSVPSGGGIVNKPQEEPVLPEISTKVTVRKQDSSILGVAEISVSGDQEKTAILHLPEKQLLEALALVEKQENDGSFKKVLKIVVKMPEKEKVENIHFLMPQKVLTVFTTGNFEQLLLESPLISMDFDKVAVKSMMAREEKNSIQISAEKAETVPEQAAAVIDGRPVFEILILSEQRQVTAFGGGRVTLGIPYTLRDGEKAENVKGGYLDTSGKITVLEESSYHTETSQLLITTPHLSAFSVVYLQNGNLPEIEKEETEFEDISAHWAKDDILFLYRKGLVAGMTETLFMPDKKMNRSMLVTILGRTAEADTKKYTRSTFSDVPEKEYYTPYVAWAAEAGLVSGMGENKFSPEMPVNREQLAVILYQYALYAEIPLEEKEADAFQDEEEISIWASEAVSRLQQAGILFGKTAEQFAPKEEATRAEVCAIIKRMLELKN